MRLASAELKVLIIPKSDAPKAVIPMVAAEEFADFLS